MCILQKVDATKDTIMVDKGFSIELERLENLVKLIMPSKLGQSQQMSAETVLHTNRIGAARVHVDRTIQRFKAFDIVKSKISWMIGWCE